MKINVTGGHAFALLLLNVKMSDYNSLNVQLQ